MITVEWLNTMSFKYRQRKKSPSDESSERAG